MAAIVPIPVAVAVAPYQFNAAAPEFINLVGILSQYNNGAAPNNVLVAHYNIVMDNMIRTDELSLNLLDFTWLVETVGGYISEQEYRTHFLLPIVATLPANTYAVAAAAGGKKVDIRQIYWCLLVLNMLSSMDGFRISSPPTHNPLSVWLFCVSRRVSEVVLVIFKQLGLDPLGNNPVFPRILPDDVGLFAWYRNNYNPLIPTKKL